MPKVETQTWETRVLKVAGKASIALLAATILATPFALTAAIALGMAETHYERACLRERKVLAAYSIVDGTYVCVEPAAWMVRRGRR